MVEKTCRECGNFFFIAEKKSREGRGVYCSRQCAGKGKLKKAQEKRSCDTVQGNKRANSNTRREESQNRILECGKEGLSEGCLVGGAVRGQEDCFHFGVRQQRHDGEQTWVSQQTDLGQKEGYPKNHKQKRNQRMLQESFSLEVCPWASGSISPLRYDDDYHASPDHVLGY